MRRHFLSYLECRQTRFSYTSWIRIDLNSFIIAIAAAFLCVAASDLAHASSCQVRLAGRTVNPDPGVAGFGSVQGQPLLRLAAKEYVITIDDGPNPQTTLQLLAVLNTYCVKATFFLIGRNAAAHPDLVKAIAAQGHAIGSHSFTHPDLGKLSEKQILAEMERGVDAVETAEFGKRRPGRPPRLIRLPGALNTSPVPPASLIEALHREGLTIAGYDLSPQDWRNSPPKQSFDRLFRGIKDRGVIVFHDGQPNTILLLPMVLDELSRRGAKIVTLLP